jgi:hypothetical protein
MKTWPRTRPRLPASAVPNKMQTTRRGNRAVWANGSGNDAKPGSSNTARSGSPGANIGGHHPAGNAPGRPRGPAGFMAILGLDSKSADPLPYWPFFRHSTEQAGLDYNRNNPVHRTIRNRSRHGAGLRWEHAFGDDTDMRPNAQNILHRRLPAALEMDDDGCRPRQIAVVITGPLRS